MDKIVLSTRGLTKTFGGFTAVDHISFSLKEGEVLGILGPNGAGKTTTLFMLLDLITPTSGDLTMFGMRYAQDREKILQRVNFASAYMDMVPRMTIMENLLIMAMLYQVKNPRQVIIVWAQSMGIESILGQEYQKLSAGQKTRAQMCKAFLSSPEILLLDEPTASLDPDISVTVRKHILDAKNRGVSVIITSHNMAEVEEICDRVLFINHGKIVAEDTPEGLAQKVRKARVQLMMTDGQKRTIAYAKRAGFPVTANGRFVTIDVDEDDIAYLLAGLADKGVQYGQITIDKPTLEDYFIAESRRNI
ncbi:MAG: ABC transporter ATP-binding protein [Candidatus Gottesmanbacteria bacterium]|nr:ABC transporter ATP-binding protein [Candidatus Gottesmanbacteria bacterium]